MEEYTEKQFTKMLLSYLVWQNTDKHIVTTQYTNAGGIADVFAVNKNLRTFEYEIKTTKQDLRGELQSIWGVLETMDSLFDDGYKKGMKKFPKHKLYLSGQSEKERYGQNSLYIPNYFYFIVPPELEKECEILKQTKYGVGISKGFNGVSIKQKAKPLHNEQITHTELLNLGRRLTYENYNLRN